jgi:hypothetical protein
MGDGRIFESQGRATNDRMAAYSAERLTFSIPEISRFPVYRPLLYILLILSSCPQQRIMRQSKVKKEYRIR